MPRDVIFTDDAPRPLGPYALGVRWERLIFTTGQVGRDPHATGTLPAGSTGGEEVSGDVREQTRQALRNVRAILRAGGADLDSVLKTTCFLADMADFAAFNEAYREFFPVDPPARSTVGVALLPPVRVMIEVVAARKDA